MFNSKPKDMKKLIIEFIGTLFLVMTIGISGNPLAIGAILMVMVYMGGHISGAHYNPAVTVAILIRGKITMGEAVRYWIAQIAGAFAGAGLAYYFKDGSTTVGFDDNMLVQALIGEVLMTFALASVVLNVATSGDTAGNSFYGLAIGFTVFAGAMVMGPISGGAFNPAVSIGHNVLAGNYGDIWVHIVGPVAGASLAAFVYKLTNND